MQLSSELQQALFEYVLALGDDRLVLGHRVSEWCGHAPILEEDIALANIALDLLGQAQACLRLAGEIEGKGRDEDKLAYFREALEFKNIQLVELPRGDFAATIARQFLFSTYSYLLLQELKESKHEALAALAAKILKETIYHVRHSGEWVVRLGDGTEESKRRISEAFSELWLYTGELFIPTKGELLLAQNKIAIDSSKLKEAWQAMLADTFKRATLDFTPYQGYAVSGSRQGRHSEHLGHLLAEMQILPRSFPNATW